MKNLLISLFVFISVLISPLSYSSLLSDKTSSTQTQTTNKTEKKDDTEGKTITKPEFQRSQSSSETISPIDKFVNLKPIEQKIIIGTILVCLVVGIGFIRYFMTGKQ